MAIIVLDVESSGHLGDSRATVIEVGAIALTSTGKELGSFSSLVRPIAALGEWSYHAMQVNQIPEALLHEAPSRDVVFDTLINWMGLYAPIEAVLAYNVSFDQKMVVKTWPLAEHFPWGPCVMRAASEVIQGDRKGVKLHVAAEAFGIQLPPGTHHRAVYDAGVAARVFAIMVERGIWAS